MECVLFRHGIAVDREGWSGAEADRPLTAKGAEKTREAAAGLRNLGLAPTHIWSSPLTRAVETAKLVGAKVKGRAELELRDELRPEVPPEKLVVALAALPADSCVLCVGHEPQLGEAAGVLLFGKPVAGLALKKAGSCCIEFDQTPKAGTGSLRWWMTPSQLRSLGQA
jgi:phosphohistidine phosphatase